MPKSRFTLFTQAIGYNQVICDYFNISRKGFVVYVYEALHTYTSVEKSYQTYLNPHPGIPMVMITKTTTWAKNTKKNAKKLKELSVLKGAVKRKR